MTDQQIRVGDLTSTAGPSTRDRITLHAVAAALCLLILTPLLKPGYLLNYDMVFVPHQPLLWELLAPSGGLPRAVPEDAVVSLLSTAVPGWLLQRLALAGLVYAAAVGAGRLVPSQRLVTRVIAAVAYVWSPFLAERLLLGQWGLLLCYAALPWLIIGALRVREGRPGSIARVLVAAAVCAITPTGGLIAFATTVVFTVRRDALARSGRVVAGAALLNAPWILAAALTEASGRSDPAGVAAFAARSENWSGALGALLGTGGVWNALTTLPSRGSILAPLVTLVLLGLAGLGFVRLRSRWPAGAAVAFVVLAAAGLATALLGTVPATADLLGWAVSRIPGAGLLRDGQKFVLPYALALSMCAALGAEYVAGRLARPRASLVLGAILVLPAIVLPDLAFGGLGRLSSVSYPADWDEVAAIVARSPGPVLSLPFSEYRTFAWNDDRTMIDPAPRYLAADVLTDDTLVVGDLTIAGENPAAARVRDLLDRGLPVTSTGVRWVLVAHDTAAASTAGLPDSALVGLNLVHKGQWLDLYANPGAAPPPATDLTRRWILAAADVAAIGLLLAAIWHLRRTATAW